MDVVSNWLPAALAADKLGITRHRLYGWCRKRLVKHRRIGGRLWVDIAQAERDMIREFPAVEGTHHAE